MFNLARLLAVARGQDPADLLLIGGRIINVFNGEIEQADIAIVDGMIAGIGPGYQATRRINLDGAYISPGLIDAHVHIESSLCIPAQFAAAVVPRGVTTVIADPHEIANVLGAEGVRFMADASKGLPLHVTLMAPSCVPATHMATSGGEITTADISELRTTNVTHGLAEMMNVPGLVAGDQAVLDKLSAMHGRPIDGHGPGLSGQRLNAYVAAGIGTDHESVTAEEAREKLSRGLYILIREATNARNLDALLPIITPSNSHRICFCTDDRTPVDLLNIGSIDEMVRRAIAFGIAPVDAIRMATLNPAAFFGLKHLGAIAPGRFADMFVFDDLKNPNARMVFSRGELVAQSGKLIVKPQVSDDAGSEVPQRAGSNVEDTRLFGVPQNRRPAGQCKIDWDKVRWDVPATSTRIRVIGSLPDQLLTDHRILPAKIVEGRAVADPTADVLKIAVIERHKATGNSAVGFIQGFGLKRGAIAGTFAHDHHNLVVIGADDISMRSASRAVANMGGGLAVAVGEQIVSALALPFGGLMSDKPISQVAESYATLVRTARELGSGLVDPFMAMSFMTLEVIPALKLTDRGLVDVEAFEFVNLFV